MVFLKLDFATALVPNFMNFAIFLGTGNWRRRL